MNEITEGRPDGVGTALVFAGWARGGSGKGCEAAVTVRRVAGPYLCKGR